MKTLGLVFGFLFSGAVFASTNLKQGDLLLNCIPSDANQTIDSISQVKLVEESAQGAMSVHVFYSAKDVATQIAGPTILADRAEIKLGKIKVNQTNDGIYVYETILESTVDKTSVVKRWALVKYWVCEDMHFEETCLGTEYIKQAAVPMICQ